MKILLYFLLLLPAIALSQVPAEDYPVDPASVEQPGVPKGETLKFVLENSRIFPGEMHEYWVYIPAQYDGSKPACVYVNQDGIQSNAPRVFDNLIHAKEMPITIGVFVTPGRVVTADPANSLDRYNRSFEYDGLGDAYARFLLEELLPAVEQQKASDGRAIRLSKIGNDRAVGGTSSGAIAAFTAAWERPNEFSKVFSAIGTYVDLRGGGRYPDLIRKYEPKPIKIFLQDGSTDHNIYAGDWWMANQMMERALTFAGYSVNHAWGEGGHNGKMAAAVFPAAMRWLWKNYPAPIVPGKTQNPMLNDILLPGEGWQLVGKDYGFTEGAAVNAKGEVYFQDIREGKTYKITGGGKPVALNIDSKKASGTSFTEDGTRFTSSMTSNQVLSYDASGKEKVVAEKIPGNDLVVAKNGNIYVTSPDGIDKPGKLYLIKPNGEKIVVEDNIRYPNGLTLTPDQTQLYVTTSSSRWVWLFSIRKDGTLANKQRYNWLHVPDNADFAWPDGAKCDTAGRLYVATNLGIQVCDQAGRVNAIIPLPAGSPSNLCFGGREFNTLYVTVGDKVYRRKVKVRGANPFENPVKPMKPKL
ncbi:SMP-30/gluconolactonase/LRE family protein [Hufsiella ginkgonis]|uniref:Gluconolactonase n=1 Tax=Hufsiella ginkgonis TaxID=2695274 RepID=A0A7K1XT19_9SPHI|nr:SMP-30/gluconolactonase/LRE family protein [Hufsiella ginkgonis]MXV13998.1 gluconolactonase [Hufsiella ginkgonis]